MQWHAHIASCASAYMFMKHTGRQLARTNWQGSTREDVTMMKTPKHLSQFTKREALSSSESRTLSDLPNSEYLFPATCDPFTKVSASANSHCSASPLYHHARLPGRIQYP